MDSPLKIDQQSDCWTFTLDRPRKMNALSSELIEALLAGVAQAYDEKIPLLVFQGSGKNLSAGFDFTDYEAQSEGDLLLRFVRIEMLLNAIAMSPSLTIAFAHGKNFGAGVDLFAVCKQRYCAPGTTFRMPGLNFGLVLGTRRFADIVGRQNALAILGETKTFSAAEAERIGFVQQTVEPDEWAGLIDGARKTAAALDHDTRVRFHGAIHENHANDDLAALVRSAARPGLKGRIARYLNG
jgi:enoyl-CoA hydratase/carnithine racemase